MLMFFLGTLIISFSYLCILAYYYYAELLYKKKKFLGRGWAPCNFLMTAT